MTKNIVIIGGGIAGLNAAKSAREADPQCSILILEEGDKGTYSRTRLPEYISGEIGLMALFLYDDEWYSKNKITLYKNCKVTDIHMPSKTVNTTNGLIKYDALIIATGSHGFVPPIPGADKENVMTVRSLEDADKVKYLAGPGRKCAIIGGGLLGLEMAWAVQQLGAEIHIIENNPRLLSIQGDEEVSALLSEDLTDKGMKIYLGADTAEITGGEKAEYVKLADGTQIPVDFVILSAGARPNISPFKDKGFDVGRGIKVNDYMETNIEGIYAAGDIAEYNGKSYGIWPIATAQGTIAGYNGAGRKTAYDEIEPFTHLKITGISMFAVGDTKSPNCNVLYETDRQNKKHVKLFIKDSKIIGAIIYGEPGLNMKVRKAIQQEKMFTDEQIQSGLQEIIANLP